MAEKNVYLFGDGEADGNAEQEELLGGKGANLAEMSSIGVPVPPGFTITTDICTKYVNEGREAAFKNIRDEVEEGIKHVEDIMGKEFGDEEDPLLVSVRSGAAVSMPGMMDTVLNLGLNDDTVEAMAETTGNPRFAWDSYRRFIQMFGDVVLGIEPEEDEIDPFEKAIQAQKDKKGVENDTDLDTEDLKELVERFKKVTKEYAGQTFPSDPWEQLWDSIAAVFGSWDNSRAIDYREMQGLPHDMGTAVNVQAMVYGNTGTDSATGVGFTRNAATGENVFNGEFLINAQGEDVVAGVRTPHKITKKGSKEWAEINNISEEKRKKEYASLEEKMPEAYQQLHKVQKKLEEHYADMQDVEFTIEQGRLWLLQTRTGKRTGAAMVKMAVDMLEEGLIDEKTAVKRITPEKLDELLHPVFDKQALQDADELTKGLGASPGAATGKIVFNADTAEEWNDKGEEVILARVETSPEDVAGMASANGVLTSRGGMTSHAAVVARGLGECCVAGAGEVEIDYKAKKMIVNDEELEQGDWISLNGNDGAVYKGKVKTVEPEISDNFETIMELAEKYSDMGVRTNADTPEDAERAIEFGATGIGLTRTEHMFFEGERIKAVREMILADDEEGRREAITKLLPMQREDFEGIFEAMDGYPVTVRLLDPPLHEFVPQDEESQKEMADELGVSFEEVQAKVESLEEQNPMLGHRGCRLGNTYPEITEMQARAILEAAMNCKEDGIDAVPEIMVPLIGMEQEFTMQKEVIDGVAEELFEERGEEIDYKVGTMIEIPRACLVADKVAEDAEFFSFGTNDLTQMTFGYSRDDVGKFLDIYKDKGLLDDDPFQVLDQTGVGQLVEMGTERGRQTNEDLKVGICGEHGGEPKSVKFCYRNGLNYVSCSPFRVPIARVATAQAAIEADEE